MEAWFEIKRSKADIQSGDNLIGEMMGEAGWQCFSKTNSKWHLSKKFATKEEVEGRVLDNFEARYTSPQYHKDWNNLMPAVEFVESLSFKGYSIDVSITGSGAIVYIQENSPSGIKFEGKTEISNTINNNYFADISHDRIGKLQGVWDALVRFAKWYKENKKFITQVKQ